MKIHFIMISLINKRGFLLFGSKFYSQINWTTTKKKGYSSESMNNVELIRILPINFTVQIFTIFKLAPIEEGNNKIGNVQYCSKIR